MKEKSQACQVSARQDSIIQPKPLPLPDVEVCNDSATKNQPVIAGMPVSLTAANQNQSLLGCQCLPAALTLITHFNHRGLRPELELNQNSRPKREKNQKPSMVPHFFIDGPKVLVQEFSSGGARRELGEFSSSGTGFEPDQKK